MAMRQSESSRLLTNRRRGLRAQYPPLGGRDTTVHKSLGLVTLSWVPDHR